MKKLNYLILIIISLSLSSCFDGTGGDYSEQQKSAALVADSTTDTPEILTPPPIEKKFLVKTDHGLYFSDGVSLEYFLPATSHKAGPYKFISGATLVTLDASGDIDTSTDLNHIPTAAFYAGDDLHSCIEITPAEATQIGARPDTYTEIFKNGVSIAWDWLNNVHGCDRIVASGDSIFIMDGSTPYLIEGTASDVQHVSKDFYIHSRNPSAGLIYFNDGTSDIQETYAANYILSAKNWQKYDGLYYSENGFTWAPGDELREAVTSMYDFNYYPYPVTPPLLFGEAPTLLAAGIVDHYIYWIECNTGYLFQYNAISDEMTQGYRLYLGDGLKVSGSANLGVLKPMIVDDILYFSDHSSLKAVDMLTGLVTVFNGGVSEVMSYDK